MERKAKVFKTNGIITEDLSFSANNNGKAIFFNLELLDSENKIESIHNILQKYLISNRIIKKNIQIL